MAHSSSAEDHLSVAAAGVAGDTSLMWTEFSGRLRAFVARRAPPGIEPDDVVQEVFLRVMRHLPSLREADRLEAWLFQIARNTLYDAMRVRQRRDSRNDALDIDVLEETSAEDGRAAEAELAPCLTPMVARLREPYRQAIELTSVHGLTQTEAAERAGVSVSGMKSRVQRAREQLKAMLLRCCEIDVDRRRGVADFHLRDSASCGSSTEAPTRLPAAASGPAAAWVLRPSQVQRVFWSGAAEIHFAAIDRKLDMVDAIRTQATAPGAIERRAPAPQTPVAPSTCCGGPAPTGTDACCARDAEVKSTGSAGCGCSSAPRPATSAAKKTGCCG